MNSTMKSDKQVPTYLKVGEVSFRLHISFKHAYMLMANGVIPSQRVGGALCTRKDALNDFIDRLEQAGSSDDER